MKISEMIQKLKYKQNLLGDVDVRLVESMTSGFSHVGTINDRRDYRDESMFGDETEKGSFVVIEILSDEQYRG